MTSTQIVNLWLHNDQTTYFLVREIAAKYAKNGKFDVAHRIQLFIEGQRRQRNENADMFSDLLSHALNEVAWEEIAADYIHEATPYQEE